MNESNLEIAGMNVNMPAVELGMDENGNVRVLSS
jgi:hypothetical protein